MIICRQFTLYAFIAASLCFAPGNRLAASPLPSAWLARTWQTDEGLPDNNVTGVAQSADGFLWVATLGGLMRFDGSRFEEFSTIHLPNIPSRGVRRMHLEPRGRLWLSTDRGGLIRVEGNSARVFTEEDGLNRNRVAAMAEDQTGTLWLVCGSVICRITKDTVERVGAEAELPSGAGAWLAADESGQLWFARAAQLGAVRGGRWQGRYTFETGPLRFCAARGGGLWVCSGQQVLKFVEGGQPQIVARLPEAAEARVLLEDRTGALWLGTATDGLWRLAGGEFKPVQVSHPEISALMEDREGNLWVGTAGGGLNLLRPRAMEIVTSKSGLPFDSVRSVCEDSEGWMWAALQNGSLARGRGAEWRAVMSADGWPGGNAACVAPAKGGGVWIGTRDRGVQRLQAGQVQEWTEREDLGSRRVRSILSASNGDLWMATDSPNRLRVIRDGRLRSLEMPGEVRSIRALVEGADGAIWAGTSDGEILRVANDRVVSQAGEWYEEPHSVRCLHATADGSLWIGYAGWGLGRWHEGTYARLGSAQGLYDDYISQILSDDQGNLWLTGNRGLFRLRLDDLVGVVEHRSPHLRSIAYGRSEGLPTVQPVCENSPAAWRGVDGRLWYSTRNGLLTVTPGEIRDNPTPPPVKLTRVSVDDKLVALYGSHSPLRAAGESSLVDLAGPDVSMNFAPGHGKLEIEFTALSFSSPENVHFRHRLQGFDQEWVPAGSQRSARYPRLPAGEYRFEVTACNEAGVWNPTGVALPFIVHPFFWQTWWFRIGTMVLFTASVVGLVRYFSFRRLRRELERLERQAELQRERARIARDMHDEVGAKLSRLSLLSEMAGQQPQLPPAAQGEVAEISETARETIRSFDEIVWAVNPKNDSLANLAHYLCRFAEDFYEGSATQCVFELPEEIPAIELSTETRHHVFLAAKEALNNALKHARAKSVAVRLRLEGGAFEIQIEDDGAGFDPAALPTRVGAGNGLGNMRERMRLASGEVELRSTPGKGTCVRFRLPCAAPQTA